jgi:hypothetical protein
MFLCQFVIHFDYFFITTISSYNFLRVYFNKITFPSNIDKYLWKKVTLNLIVISKHQTLRFKEFLILDQIWSFIFYSQWLVFENTCLTISLKVKEFRLSFSFFSSSICMNGISYLKRIKNWHTFISKQIEWNESIVSQIDIFEFCKIRIASVIDEICAILDIDFYCRH